MKTLTLPLFAVALVAAILVLPTTARAEHDDHAVAIRATLYRAPIASIFRADGFGIAHPLNSEDGVEAPAILGDLGTRSYGSVPVCADSTLAVPVQQAVSRWATGLSSVVGRNVFRYEPHPLCATSSGGPVSRIVVAPVTATNRCSTEGAVGCFVAKRLRGAPDYTYLGQLEILFDEDALHVDTNFDGGPMATLTDAEKRAGVMTHELGHTLGFGHHWEPLPLGQPLPLGPCTTTSSGGAPQTSVMHAAPCGSPTVQPYDRTAFKVGYSPAKVASIAVTNASTAGRVLISWDGSNVHVERGFEVHVKVRYGPPLSVGWLRVTTAQASAPSIEFAKPTDGTVYSIITQAATTSAPGSYGTYRVISLSDALVTTDPTSLSDEVNHVQPRLPVVTYINVCVEWEWYLSWHNTILDEVRSVRVRGYATAAAARAVMEASAALIGTGGFGAHDPFPILSQRVYCSAYVSVPVGGSARGTSETTSSVSADTSAEPVSDSSALTPVQRVDAALTTLTTCLRDITTPAEKNTCVSAYADALDAIEEGDGAQ